MFDVATIPDLLRLVAVPAFAWASWRDIRTRRVSDRFWLPLYGLGAVILVWDTYMALMVDGLFLRVYIVQVAISLGVVAPAAYAFWRLGTFGGADKKALYAIAVLFPAYPSYSIAGVTLPLNAAIVGVFSLTILSNTVLVGLVYPMVLAIRNAIEGRFTPFMFVGRPVSWEGIETTHGRLLETESGFTRTGLDLDALRMYLEWRGRSLADLRSDPDRYRDPASLPRTPNRVGDGAVRADGGDGPIRSDGERRTRSAADPWGAAAFVDDVGRAYGTTPESLRDGLEVLVRNDRVWVSPGIPFIVPIFLGLVLALTYGDLLYSILSAIGFIA